MSHTYNIHSTTVLAVAALLGCAPGYGLVNTLNAMLAAGRIRADMKVGSIYAAFLAFELQRLVERQMDADAEDEA